MKSTKPPTEGYLRYLKFSFVALFTAAWFRRPIVFEAKLANFLDMGAFWVLLESLKFIAIFTLRGVAAVLLLVFETGALLTLPLLAYIVMRRDQRIVEGKIQEVLKAEQESNDGR